MSIASTYPSISHSNASWQNRALGLIVAAEVLVLLLPAEWWVYLAIGILSVGMLFAIVRSVVYGQAAGIILGWMLIFPMGYYYASFPKDQPIFTLDRAFIGMLLVAACFVGVYKHSGSLNDLRKPATWWGIFLIAAAITIPHTKSPIGGLRILVDGFVLPAILAWFVVRWFDVREHFASIHAVVCLMSIGIAGIGVAEVITQQDLLLLPESSVILAGDVNDSAAQIWLRPNGPFSSTNSYALIGLVSFLFLLFLKSAMPQPIPGWQKYLHRLGISAALLTSFLPLFRSVLTSIVVILLVDAYYSKGLRRLVRMWVIGGFALIVLLMQLALPQILQDRTDPENVFGRIAEQRQIKAMFLDNPISGVGFNNFFDAAQKEKYVAYYQGVQSVDFPHNNLGAILVETGLSGLIPFVVSQVFLVLAFWKFRNDITGDGMRAWKFFIFLFIAYWVNGMSLASGYYSDLNLWYMTALAMIYKYAASTPVFNKPLVVSSK